MFIQYLKDPLQTCFKMYMKHFALIHNVVLISIFFPQKSSVVGKKKKKKYCFSLIKNSDFAGKSVLSRVAVSKYIITSRISIFCYFIPPLQCVLEENIELLLHYVCLITLLTG